MNPLRLFFVAVLCFTCNIASAFDNDHHPVDGELWKSWMNSTYPNIQGLAYGYLGGVMEATRPAIEQMDREAKDGQSCSKLLYETMGRGTTWKFLSENYYSLTDRKNPAYNEAVVHLSMTAMMPRMLVIYCDLKGIKRS